jgi:hypothetical protein
MQLCRDLSEQSTEQQNALAEMIRYNIQLIKENGELEGSTLPYKDNFAEASQSLKRLFEITQTVPRPLITQPFQFKVRG